MFESFVGAKVEKRRQRTRTIAVVSIVVHAGFLLGLLVHGFWQIERLGLPKREITLAVAPPLEVPDPPAPSVKRPPQPERKVLVRPDVPTQPVNRPVDENLEVEIVTEDPGSNIGVEGGSPGGNGKFPGIGDSSFLPNRIIETPPPPAPVAPKQPEMVAPTVVEAQRIAGQKLIQPDDGTKLQMAREGRQRIEARVKMCLSASGDVARTSLVRPSGYPEYDAIILATMQAWKYRPYLVNGEAAPVCTQVTFIYSQQ